MLVVNSKTGAAFTQNAPVKTNRQMGTAMEQLSTGQRINGVKDCAARLAIASRVTPQVISLSTGVRAAATVSTRFTPDGASGSYAFVDSEARSGWGFFYMNSLSGSDSVIGQFWNDLNFSLYSNQVLDPSHADYWPRF